MGDHRRPETASRRNGREWLRGFGALLLLVVLVAGIPAVLITIAGLPLAHGVPSFAHLIDRTRGPDDGRLLLDLLLTLAWVGWAAITVTAAAETVALARHTVAPALLGLGALQPSVGLLLATAALLLPAGHVVQLGVVAQQARPSVAAPLVTPDQPGTVRFAAASPAADPAAAATDAAAVLPVYVVGADATGERDTLWSIAGRHLGDPLRWQEIARLNAGRAQADGGVFTDPAVIRPGWRLVLPADATGLNRPAGTAPVSSPVRPETEPTSVPAPVIAPPEPAAPKLPKAAAPSPPSRHARPSSPSIQLGPGSEIGGALAAALLIGISLRRLRRRQRYQPRPPRPAQLAGHEPIPPPLRQLLAQSPAPAEATVPLMEPIPEVDSACSSWEIGVRGEEPITIGWAQHPVLAFAGDGAADVIRALLVAALVDQRGTEILDVGDLLVGLLPGLTTPTGVEHVSSASAAFDRLQVEVLSRTRRLADADVADAATYRQQHPEDPFPPLMLLADPAFIGHQEATALLTANGHLDISALILDSDASARTGRSVVTVDADGELIEVQPQPLAAILDGVALYRLTSNDAVTLMTAALPADEEAEEPRPAEPAADVDWNPGTLPVVEAARPPIRVQLLGPVRIWVSDTEVTTGLRESARQLLAWYLLHPDGRPADAAIEALWPDIPIDRGPQRFWNALGNLRGRLRSSEDKVKLDILQKTGGSYRPQRSELDVDLWTFQAALQQAADASDPGEKMAALRVAIDSYAGSFAADADYLWVDPIREEIHRRALDAHIAYADLTATENPEQAIATLERVLELDPYAEDTYRRLIHLQHSAGRKESVRLLWKQLNARLADIDSEPDEESRRQYRVCL